jgi:hypothetical protein
MRCAFIVVKQHIISRLEDGYGGKRESVCSLIRLGRTSGDRLDIRLAFLKILY